MGSNPVLSCLTPTLHNAIRTKCRPSLIKTVTSNVNLPHLSSQETCDGIFPLHLKLTDSYAMLGGISSHTLHSSLVKALQLIH